MKYPPEFPREAIFTSGCWLRIEIIKLGLGLRRRVKCTLMNYACDERSRKPLLPCLSAESFRRQVSPRALAIAPELRTGNA
jgi:hypothetical protein